MTQTIIHVPASEGAGAFDPTDIEITDGVDDAFLIKDTGGNEWFKIDTRSGTGSDCINMAYTSGQRVLIGKPASASQGPYSPFQVINQNLDSQAVRIYGSASYGTTNQFTWGGPGNQPAMIHPYGLLFGNSAATGMSLIHDSSNADMFAMDDNTNATFTLDDGSGAVFKVVDDNASPKTYFSATENGNIQVGDSTGSVNLNADATGVSLRSNNIELRNGSANPLVTFSTDEVVYNGGGILTGDSYYGAPTDSTATETIANKEIHINQTFQYETTASAAGTVTVQFFTDRSFYSDGTTPTLRMVTLLNKNATHNVTYIFNVRSGYGTAYAMDSNATSLTGSGLTLTPGQAAIFRLVTFNKTSTDSDAKHYFTTLGVG